MQSAASTDAAVRQSHLKLVVLGATGATGREVVRQATERGHLVTAFVQEPDRLGVVKNQIPVKKGDLLDSSQLAQGIESHDVVISAFGPRVPISKADVHLLQQFATALTRAMEKTRVRRVVVESVAFLFKDSIIPPAYLVGKLLFPSIVADSAAMERIFFESSLDWTMVRPPELTNKPYREVPRKRRPPSSLRLRDLTLGRGGFHD